MIVTDCRARHGVDAVTYQRDFDRLFADGYRLVKVSGHEFQNQARYAGIWYRRGGNPWQARHGISDATYHSIYLRTLGLIMDLLLKVLEQFGKLRGTKRSTRYQRHGEYSSRKFNGDVAVRMS